MTAVERRQARLGPFWIECVKELRERGLVTPQSRVAYRDRDEVRGQQLFSENDQAVPVTWTVWVPPKPRGKPRGLSVNRGNKYKGVLDD